jgi:anthranilate phosphoribosyltransferase
MNFSVWSPDGLPLQRAALVDLAGGDRHVNAAIIERLLRGEETGPKLDAVLLNAGAALMVAGAAKSIFDGWELAAETITRGSAAAKLAELRNATR